MQKFAFPEGLPNTFESFLEEYGIAQGRHQERSALTCKLHETLASEHYVSAAPGLVGTAYDYPFTGAATRQPSPSFSLMDYTTHACTHEQVTSGTPTPLTVTKQPPIGANPSQRGAVAASLGRQEHGTSALSAAVAVAAIRVGDVVWAPIPCPGAGQAAAHFAMALVLPDAGPPMTEPTTSPGCELDEPRSVEPRQYKEAEAEVEEDEEGEEEEDYFVPRPRKRRTVQPWAAGRTFDYAR